ncbi:MAG TPA: PmoA family protein [Sedimentisphaerales bacterium]|nr:PmoA family protein [Sedimentisphaerales bacterium]
MKKLILLSVVFSLAGPLAIRVDGAKVELIKGDNKVDVQINGKPFTTYLWGDQAPKPVLVPVRTPSGIEVTRRYPLTKLEGGTDDHLHHVGIFFTVDGVNGTKFWNTVEPPPQIRHRGIKEITGGTNSGKLVTTSQWVDKSGKVVLEDERTMVFLAGGGESEYAIDFSLDLTAMVDKVVFEDTEEGVFAIRVADCLREKGPKEFLQPGQPAPEESIKGTGVYMSSNGDVTAKQAWGKRARWMVLQGVKDGKVVGVAVFNHPASINYPTYWHVRNYGLFSANPLGQGDFQRQSKYKKNPVIPLRLTLKKGEKAHFRFLVVVYEGIKTKEDLEERFKEFAE